MEDKQQPLIQQIYIKITTQSIESEYGVFGDKNATVAARRCWCGGMANPT